MMARKFSSEVLDQAEEMRVKGEKWIVIEAILGEGVKGAVYHRKHVGYVAEYREPEEIQAALMAWNGLGDKQSFLDGWTNRAKREKVFK
jgi:hypothetical protein